MGVNCTWEDKQDSKDSVFLMAETDFLCLPVCLTHLINTEASQDCLSLIANTPSGT